MSLKEWYRDLGPKRKFAIKALAKVAAVSAPHSGNQIHTLFETAFEDLKDHEGMNDLMELTQLVNERFDQLITQVESMPASEAQVEAVIARYQLDADRSAYSQGERLDRRVT